MAKDQLIDSRVSEAQCAKAVEALHQWAAKQAAKEAENELLPGKEPLVWLCVALKKAPSGMSFKPVKIPIKHPLVDPRTNGICLLTKDPQRDYKDLLEEKNIKFISRVIGVEKLKGKFKPYEARRILLKENGLFLADERIVPLLPKLLGAKWFDAKKQPIPVSLTRKDLKGELERAISSTYMNQNKGTAVSIKIGTLSQKPSQILDNLKTAIPAVASHITNGGWDNIQSLGIKTNNSVHLPIWSCSLDDEEGGRWAGLTAADDEDEDAEIEDGSDGVAEEDEEMEVEEPAPVSATKGKKKRAAEDVEDEAEQEKPKKKAKSQVSESKVSEEPKAKSTDDKLKAKKRKEPKVPATAPESTEPKVDDATSKKKKRKSDVSSEPADTPKKPAPASQKSIPTPTTDATAVPESSKKSKKKDAPAPLSAAVSAAMEVDATPSAVKTKKAAIAEVAPTPANTPAAGDSKSKKGRASIATEEEEAAVEETPKEKKKKRKSISSSAELVPEVVVEETPKQEKKKSRKSVSTQEATEASETPQPVPEPIAEVPASTKKGKKEKRKSLAGADSEPLQTPKKDNKVSVDDVLETPSETPGEKKKRRKVKKKHGESGADDAQEDTRVAESLTSEELKQKKAAGAGEKKKEKVVKARGGKSVKDAVTGKKVAQ
ncbi:proteasome-interacting protein cic1 [Paramarasmius palmivorus]|uniref:Ribosomal L1 domain-containing protein 1 n=1 Tax=Paramarasmius palmivorus TaxID=297713 RepID=A0AAW0DJ91_9AGAR